MTADKPCERCGGKKGPKYARKKYCYRCVAAVRRESREKAHRTAVAKRYNMPPGLYDELLEAQGGLCALCRRASGKTKRLAVDHDHACCPVPPTCGKCTRGLLCGTCNNKVLGQARDEIEFFERAIEYLKNPPARRAA